MLAALGDNMEIRKYGPIKWACASINSVNAKNSLDYNNNLFAKLFNYISGVNHSRQKIPMTSPVTFDYRAGAYTIAPDSNVRMTMRFFLPNEYYFNTPLPVIEGTYLQEDPAAVYAVVRFGGYANAMDYMKLVIYGNLLT